MSVVLKIRDTDPEYRFLCIQKDAEGNPTKIWGVYCTYYRFSWDQRKEYYQVDDAFIFSGNVNGPFRYTFSVAPRKLRSYVASKLRENYSLLKVDDFTSNPVYDKVRELVSKKMFWKLLSN